MVSAQILTKDFLKQFTDEKNSKLCDLSWHVSIVWCFILIISLFNYWLNGHKIERTVGDSEGQESLACCSSRGCKESDMTEWLKTPPPQYGKSKRRWIWDLTPISQIESSLLPFSLMFLLISPLIHRFLCHHLH